MKEFNSNGTICVKDSYNFIYAVCDIFYNLKEDGSFKYVFKPNYSVISLLNAKLFQGIPGLDLDLKKEEYIRENFIPTFISERVPSKKREDYIELLESVNMDFMDPLEYLKRTKLQYFGDNFFLTSYNSNRIINCDNSILNGTSNSSIKNILKYICLGYQINIENQCIDDQNRKLMFDVLYKIYQKSIDARKILQKEGINKAKEKGIYKGRKPIEFNINKFYHLNNLVSLKKISVKDAAKQLEISVDKFYRERNKLIKTI